MFLDEFFQKFSMGLMLKNKLLNNFDLFRMQLKSPHKVFHCMHMDMETYIQSYQSVSIPIAQIVKSFIHRLVMLALTYLLALLDHPKQLLFPNLKRLYKYLLSLISQKSNSCLTIGHAPIILKQTYLYILNLSSVLQKIYKNLLCLFFLILSEHRIGNC